MKWGEMDKETAREIVRAAENYLDAQLRLATSADLRAATLASAFTLAGTGVIAGLITAAATTTAAQSALLPVYLGGGITALMFLAGALVCVRTTMPVEFWLAGNEPENWRDDVDAGAKLEKMLSDQASNYQTSINRNDEVVRAGAKAFRFGALLGVAAPFVGALVWALVTIGRFAL